MTSKIIIIADKKKASIDAIYQYLIDHGYDIKVVYDGLDGFNLVREEKPDLVLIESALSGFNGYQICSLLKYDIKYEDIITIILSDISSDREKILAESSGSDGILTTPVDLNELLGIVKTIDFKNE